MSHKASLAFLILVLGATSAPFAIASAATPSEIQAQKAAQAKKAKLAKQRQLQLQQQKEAQKKKDQEWYAEDRDRGLDVAEKYAPNAIKGVRKNNYIAKGDTVDAGGGKGWQQYMNKYYKP